MNPNKHTAGTGLPVNEVLNYYNLDVIHRIAKDNNLSLKEAGGVFQDTLRFLYLAGTTREKNLVPTKRIDQGWHCFLLFTKDYMAFCESKFGHFIHHEPNRLNAPKKAIDGAARTFDLARTIFGQDLSPNWQFEIRGADCDTNKCNSSCSPDTGGGGSECAPDIPDDKRGGGIPANGDCEQSCAAECSACHPA